MFGDNHFEVGSRVLEMVDEKGIEQIHFYRRFPEGKPISRNENPKLKRPGFG